MLFLLKIVSKLCSWLCWLFLCGILVVCSVLSCVFVCGNVS